MSAFMVSEDTLDLLASVAGWGRDRLFIYAGEDILPPRSDLPANMGEGNYYGEEEGAFIKEELRRENEASLWARYPKDGGEMAGEGAKFRRIFSDQASIEETIGALRCYEYQACESDTWKNSYAFALCQAIRARLCARISGDNWEYMRPASMAERVRII
jgi:hypothetical protein